MSSVEQSEQNQTEIAEETQKVQEAMLASTSGKALLEASQTMAQSAEMVDLMETIDKGDVGEDDKFLMGKYMGQLLQEDPANGLYNYAEYLREIASDPDYLERKDYFEIVADKSILLSDSESFGKYVEKYDDFENDESQDAENAREAMNQMSEKMKSLMDERE